MANGCWYITTREGIDVGPFKTRPDAVKAGDRLIELLRPVSDPGEARKPRSRISSDSSCGAVSQTTRRR